jgi:predicted membrane-bound spermidine synthase
MEGYVLGKLFFLSVVVIAGAITGAEFPIANAVFMRAGGRIGTSAALTECTDHLGAALGAFLTGVLLLPILGTMRTCVLLSLINALSATLIAIWLAVQKRAAGGQ